MINLTSDPNPTATTIVLVRAGDRPTEAVLRDLSDRLRSGDVPITWFARDDTLPAPGGAQGYDAVLVVDGAAPQATPTSAPGAEATILTVASRVLIDRPTPPDSVHSFVTVRRHPALTHAEFSDYWSARHGPLVLETPDVVRNMTFYAQHVVDEPRCDEAAPDGVAQSAFASVDAMKKIFRSPQRSSVAEDELRFLDGPRCVVTLCRRVDVRD